nr:hypothetical protein [Tanacetum cinerariifolium]
MLHQETMGDTSAHTRYGRVSKISSDSLLAGFNTPRSDEDRLKHIELMKICTTLQKKVFDLKDELKRTKTAQQTKIDGLERVISSSDDEAFNKEDTSKQGRIDEIDADEDIALFIEVVTTAKMIIDTIVDAAHVTTAIADVPVSAAKTIVTNALTITAESTKTNVEVQDKGKGKVKLIEEPKMPKKRKHQIKADKELAEKLQAKILHEEEQLQFTDAEKAKLFMEFIEKGRKFFAVKRDDEKRNKPPTKAQQRSIVSTYLKNMDGWKLKSLKKKSFAKIQELFDKAMKRINTFVDFRTELVEESSKKAEAETTQESSSKREGDELEQERSKKQKMKGDKESKELK